MPEPDDDLPVGNLPPDGFMVGARADMITVLALRREFTHAQALNLAAWLVAIADPEGEEFLKYLNAIRKT